MNVLVISNVTAGEFKIDIVQFIDLTDWIGNLFHLSILPGKILICGQTFHQGPQYDELKMLGLTITKLVFIRFYLICWVRGHCIVIPQGLLYDIN